MKAKLHKTYNIVIKLVVVIITILFLYNQFFLKEDVSALFLTLTKISTGVFSNIWLLIVALLIPVNLLLESIKWKYLISKLEPVSLLNSFKAVLAGISVSMIMPNRVGDYLGRVFILKKADRLQAILSTVLGSFAQLITTLLFGLIALIFYYTEYISINNSLNFWVYIGFIIVVIAMVFIMIFAYLNFSVFSIILKRISGKYYLKIAKYAEVFSWYNQKELFNVLMLSIIRYLVFSFQFYLLLQFFEVSVNYFEAMMLIAVVYFFMTIIPTIALTEIGVRGSVSLFIFQHHFETFGIWSPQLALGVITASSLLWLANVVLPAAIGTIFVFSLKFFRK